MSYLRPLESMTNAERVQEAAKILDWFFSYEIELTEEEFEFIDSITSVVSDLHLGRLREIKFKYEDSVHLRIQ